MRVLLIVRHAEATPAPAGGRDYARRLTERGQRQCDQVREWVADPAHAEWFPLTALVSGAARTQETYRRIFGDDEHDPARSIVRYDSDLIYNGQRDVSAEDMLIDLAAVDPVTTSLLVVGHNPTITELLWTLLGDLPESAREGAPVGSVYVLALAKNEPVGRREYELVTSFVPD